MKPILKLVNRGRGPGFSTLLYPVTLLNSLSNQYYTEIINSLFKILQEQIIDHEPKAVKIFILMRYQYVQPEDFNPRTDHIEYRTLTKGKIIEVNEVYKARYLKLILDTLAIKSNDYDISEGRIEFILFDFFVIPDQYVDRISERWDDLSQDKYAPIELEPFNINGSFYKIPANRKYSSWGVIVNDSDSEMSISANFEGTPTVIFVNKNNNTIKVTSGSNLLCTFTDIDSPTGIDIFIREFESGERFYINTIAESIILKIKPVKTDFIPLSKAGKNRSRKFGTIDIESIITSGDHKPAIFSFYDGKESYTFKTASELLVFILNRRYKGFTFYAHNLSRFDFIFLFTAIALLTKERFIVKIIRKDDKIIAIRISDKNRNISITIKDSMLLLPQSLYSLAINFNLAINKTPMPVYKGKIVPKYYTSDADQDKYLRNVNVKYYFDIEEWMTAIAEYCENDCIVLHNVLSRFADLIWDQFKIDIHKTPTTPSLAFAIYRTLYMPEGAIPVNKGLVYKFIRRSYTGGSTEMYKPDCRQKNIFCYDVNSLYPSVMANNLYPSGNMFLFDGDITILNQLGENRYWIGEAEVESIKNINQPYLQIHLETSDGWRTVAPLGKFKMVIHSPEYTNAVQRGDYNLKITKGYLFDKTTDLFSGYVNAMYSLRLQYPKGHPMNFIAKLLMNSLYGRFGMHPQLHSTIFCSFAEFQELSVRNDIEIESYLAIDSDIYFVSYSSLNDNEFNKALPSVGKGGRNVSVAVASAVTSYARVHMSQFKNNSEFNLVYTDTDSIFIDKPLPDNMVTGKLGGMKHEYTFKDSVFIAPKVYAGYTEDNKYICKVKGFNGELPFDDMVSLLNEKSNLNLSHVKWYRNLGNESINMRQTDYTLHVTDSKREMIYQDGIAVDTRPIVLPAPSTSG